MSRREQGFTLIETLITLVIVAVVGLSLFSVLQVSQKSVQDQKAIIETQQNARIALNAIAEDFRHVSYGKDATQASIDYANTDSVQFVADLFDSDGAEIITYSLMADGDADTPNPNDRILVKTVTDTTGAVLVSAPQSYGLAANGLNIRYFNGIGNELLPPVPQPELIGEIQVSVTAVSPRPLRNGNYHEVTLTTTIYPRNLPLTPSRSRPRPPGPGSIGSPNCEAITLNWTTPTTNTDDTPLALNDISHFNLYVGTNPGEMNLNSRLARNINQWTVGNLPAGFVYYFEITCVGTNGVESYPYEREVDLIAGFVAQAPATLNATLTAGAVNLSWPNVTLFEDGSTISTPIYYNVYRDLDPTFTADEDNLIGSTPVGDLSYVDNTGSTCNVYYYRVAAVACGSAGTSSAARQVYNPAPPSTVASLNGTLGMSDGELIASWTPPSTRMDGTSLSPSDIGHYYVYYDTIPGSYRDSVMVGGGSTSATLTGLANCSTYYVNARAYDTCGFPGDLILSNEVGVTLSNPCTPEPPEPPSDLLVNSGDDYVTMTWRASPDCDLSGYLVYYGFNDGGPYTGVGATQGNSPVFVPASAVTVGNTCSYQLSGLDPCVSYYVRVTAIDQCGVSNESVFSSQSVGATACLTCAVQPTCSPWLAAGPGYKTVAFSVYSTVDDQVDEMSAFWAAGGTDGLYEVWANGNLVWRYDGTAGYDGNNGPALSGTSIRPYPFDILASYTEAHGMWMSLVFNRDMRGEDVQVDFTSTNGSCSVTGTPKPTLFVDDFDDGDFAGWTPESGAWVVDEGTLAQLDDTGAIHWIDPGIQHGTDFVFDTSIQLESGYYAMLQFNRVADTRYIGFMYYYSQSLYLGSFTPAYVSYAQGAYTFEPFEWHRIRVEKLGSTYRVYGNCELVVEQSLFPEPASGKFGVGTYLSKVRFDDIAFVEY